MRAWFLIIAVVLCGCSGSPESNVRKGEELLRSRDYEGAKTRFNRAIQSNRLYGPAYLGMGRASLASGNLADADASFRRAVELLPPGSKDRREADIALADVYLRMELHESRLQHVENVGVALCKLDYNSVDGRRLLGHLALLRAEVRSRIGHKERAQFYLTDAENEFALADRTRPNQPEVMRGLARSLAVGGKYPEAERVYRSLIALEPANPVWRAELYRLLLMQNETEAAEESLVAASKAIPHSPEFAVMRAAQTFVSKPADLPAAIQGLEAGGKDWPSAYVAAGDFEVRSGNLDRARAIYQRCTTHSKPARESCRSRLLTLLSSEGKIDEARKLAKQMLADNRDDVSARLVDVSERIEARDLAKALNELQSMVVYDPRNFEAHYQLARVHMLSGEVEQARQQLTEALELNPDFLDAQLKLAQIQVIRGEYKPAVQLTSKILSKHPDSDDARAIREYAERRVQNPNLRGLGGAPADNARRLGQLRLVLLDDSAASASTGSADRTLARPLTPPAAISPGSIYLRNTMVDNAIAAVRTLSARNYDRFEFTHDVPGLWPPRPKN
jgi:tetratricopeptide (TPR) repeat protein